jgi:[ribosomal protein S5]-alanine N-acetyltransferase
MPIQTPTIHTPRLLLRPFTTGDTEAIYALMSNTHVLRYWDAPPWHDPSRADRFITHSAEMAQEDSGIRLAIERTSDGAFIGWCSIMNWDPNYHIAMIGYCLSDSAWGQGFATEAARAALQWAFDTLNLNRVQSGADTRNRASERVLEKLGFVREGTLRESCIVNGEVSDDSVYGLLRREWKQG